jgi:hypothetical protein
MKEWPSFWQRCVFGIAKWWLKRNGYAWQYSKGRWEVTW